MFYIKAQLNDAVEIKVDLYEDEIFTTCPKCGKEVAVSHEALIDILKDCDFPGTCIYCPDCSGAIHAKRLAAQSE